LIRGCFKSIFGNIKASVNQPPSLPYLLREETKGKTFGKTFVTGGVRVTVSPPAGKRFTRGVVYFVTYQTSSAFENILISTGGGTS
jgi:hypothetical protein